MLILFGHQSVGQDILHGIRDLAQDGLTTPALRALHCCPASTSGLTLAHFRVGTNGSPQSKLEDFCRTAMTEPGLHAFAAMFKFCYVDCTEPRVVRPLFEAYERTIDRLQLRRPELRIAHITVPLRSAATGPAAAISRFLARRYRDAEGNIARETFNDHLREKYGPTSMLFDLAAIESGQSTEAPPASRRPVASLSKSFTSDGGHLNANGRRVVAAEFIRFLQRLALTPSERAVRVGAAES